MEGNARTWFTPKQRAELWERWKSGQCVADIARALERRNKSGVYRVLAINGGIAPSPRRRAACRAPREPVDWALMTHSCQSTANFAVVHNGPHDVLTYSGRPRGGLGEMASHDKP
jgi:hypothetical protein